jgi:hypothetical protein
MPANITFRTQLIGGVSEFCTESSIEVIANTLNLVEVIVMIARHKEEGRSLFPELFIFSDFQSALKLLPGTSVIELGYVKPDADGLKTAVKKAAPLANSGWNIFITQVKRRLRYGLFRAGGGIFSVPLSDVLFGQSISIPVVKVSQIAEDCVELIRSNGPGHLIFLSHKREESPHPLDHVARLVSCITKKSDKNRDTLNSFLKNFFHKSLRESHGALIAVVNGSQIPRNLSRDGIILGTPIDFSSIVGMGNREDLHVEQAYSSASLVGGMLNSDGIVLFDDSGRVRGFNVFVKSKKSMGVSGGARRRAYAALCDMVDRDLAGAFVQSQDGWSEFRGGR